VAGYAHYLLGERTNLKSAMALSYNENGDDEDYIERISRFRSSLKTITKQQLVVSSTLNHRFDNKTSCAPAPL